MLISLTWINTPRTRLLLQPGRRRYHHRLISGQGLLTGLLLIASLAIGGGTAIAIPLENNDTPSEAGNAEFRRPRSWLDPLKSSAKRIDTSTDAPPQVESDFDLSEYTHGPAQSKSPPISPFRMATQTDSQQISVSAERKFAEESETQAQEISSRIVQQPMTAEGVFSECPPNCQQDLCWQILPKGLIYKTYLAGEKEPRMQFVSFYDTKSKRSVWDAVLGGRAGILRYGNASDPNADVFQLDLEGAVFARVLPEETSAMLEGSDYRVGLYGTWKFGRQSYRFGYYHISSHVGDEYLLAHPLFNRINYVRDSLLAGTAYQLSDASRIYGELGYALGAEGGAKPFELQIGAEHAPVARTPMTGAPFVAVNGHFREDFNFQGGVNIVSGWGWQGPETKRRLRLGLNYYNGPSLQYEFFDRWENLVGGGIWLDY